ncbi:TPA: MarR family transcriptional repressor MexR, partial [Pseudomonas aeruginosa]|nr:MarR family transcriptional repressor MexR [Pseudomonas aeruginosa]
DEGLAIHQHAEAIMSRVHDELFAPLTPEEQATLVHLLDQCLAAQPLEDI